MINSETKKIAILLPTASTGGIKYLYLLVQAIIKLKPNYQIKVWKDHLDPYLESLLIQKLSSLGVTFESFDSRAFVEKKKCNIKFINDLFNKLRKKRRLSKGLSPKVLNDNDLVFCPWPYNFDCPTTDAPIVCVPHDFNYAHHFGINTYGYENASIIRAQHKIWFERSNPVVSTNFMAQELRNTFPNFNGDVSVAHLSKLNDFEKLTDEKVEEIFTNYGINFNYILCANNTCYHKNLNILYGGYYHLKEKYPNLKLVMVGHGTEGFRGKSNSTQSIDIFQEDPDIIGLGLVSDEVLIALMQRASSVINSSLYEAGNGSGLDAWGLGTPVAMSDIAPFREQLDVLGVKAQLFDPQSSKDLAQAVIKIIENPEQTKEDVEISLNAINNYSWEKVAQKYITIFEKTMKEKVYK